MVILRDSDYDVVYTDISQIISLQGCFSLQDSEEIKSQSVEKVSYECISLTRKKKKKVMQKHAGLHMASMESIQVKLLLT